MSKETNETTPLLPQTIGDSHLTFEKLANIIRTNPQEAQRFYKVIRDMPEQERKDIVADFARYSRSSKISNGNWAVFEFFAQVLKEHKADIPQNIDYVQDNGCIIC